MFDRDPAGLTVPHSSPRSWHLFGVLAVATVVVTFGTNRIVISEEVYGRLVVGGDNAAAQVARLVEEARRWEMVSYLLSPILLLVRVAFSALLVQLALLLQGIQRPLASVFRAALWAQAATWLGAAAQLLWISFLPTSALSIANLEIPPGALASLFSVSIERSPAVTLLLQQITLFDLAWITLFATALEDSPALRARAAFVAVLSTWVVLTAVRWGGMLFLTGAA